MINLLPPQGKKVLHREYVLRVVAVAGFVMSFSLLASAAALVPTYVLFSIPETPTTESKEGERGVEEYADITETLTNSMRTVQYLGKPVESIKASEIISHIEKALSEKITLEGIRFLSEKETVRVEVRGNAETRESLRTLLEKAKRDPFFADAQVPVSDLARDTNVVFTLTLTPAS